jgi:hypothetical protein
MSNEFTTSLKTPNLLALCRMPIPNFLFILYAPSLRPLKPSTAELIVFYLATYIVSIVAYVLSTA